jgi:hypothetical protein
LKTIFETCIPRDEVLKGELREQQFAASLTKVLRGEADEVYGDLPKFFSNTFPTGADRDVHPLTGSSVGYTRLLADASRVPHRRFLARPHGE